MQSRININNTIKKCKYNIAAHHSNNNAKLQCITTPMQNSININNTVNKRKYNIAAYHSNNNA